MQFKYLKLNSTVLHTVTRIDTVRSHRGGSINTAFSGKLLVDVGATKKSLTANIGICSETIMSALRTMQSNMAVNAEYYQGTTLTTMSGIIQVLNEPAPIYLYGDKSNGIYYLNVVIAIEEV